jgi:hypothetical protein
LECCLARQFSFLLRFGLLTPQAISFFVNSVPVWVAALLLLIAYGILVGPLKLARRSCYWGLGQSRWAWPFAFFLDAIIWLAVVFALLFLAIHFFPERRDAIHGFPSVIQQAADDIRTWWHGK